MELVTVKAPPTSIMEGAFSVEFNTVKSEFACTYNEPSTESVTPSEPPIVIGAFAATVDKLGFVRLSAGVSVNN